jgi:hypothetical protein
MPPCSVRELEASSPKPLSGWKKGRGTRSPATPTYPRKTHNQSSSKSTDRRTRARNVRERPGLGAAIARPEGLVNTPDKVANALATLRRCRDSIDSSAYRNAICTRVGRLPAPRFAFREGVLSHLGGERNASALARVRLGQARNVSDENAILRTRCRVLRQLDKPVRRSTVRCSNQSPEVEASLFDRTVSDRSRRAATTHGKPHDKEDDDRTEHAHRPAARLLGHGQRC